MLLSVILLLFAGVITGLYFFLIRELPEEEQPTSLLWAFSLEERVQGWQFEHRALSDGIRARDNFNTLIGGIIVSALSVIIAESFRSGLGLRVRALLVFTALALFAVWLLCSYCTSHKLDDIGYQRLRFLEKRLDIHVARYMREKTRGKQWIFFRRQFWLIIFWILTLFSCLTVGY